VTDRYTKAVDQLGSDKGLDVRIGGIYALERVARDSARDHHPVMEVLCAFIRGHSREPLPRPTAGSDVPNRIRADVQAAVYVIGGRNAKRDRARIDLGGVNFVGADLMGANLSSAINESTADFNRTIGSISSIGPNTADWVASRIQAVVARVTTNLGSADLTGANLVTANLYLADLTGADLAGANLTGANLTDANLTGANLTGAHLTSARLTKANLTGADLTGVDLTSAKLTDADLTDALVAAGSAIPEGWQRDADTGRLKRVEIGSGEATTN
jgi:hypothetical protein